METSTSEQMHDQKEYETYLSAINRNMQHQGPLFITDAKDLFPAFLNALPEELRQHYTCNACRHFVERFGGVVLIDDQGKTYPVMWPLDVPDLYRDPNKSCFEIVQKAKVAGVFLSDEKTWGQPITGEWHHMAILNAPAFKHSLLTPFQAMAEKKEDFKTIISGLLEFPLSAINTAITLLKTDSLPRSEKCLDVAEWLRNLHEKRNATKNSREKENLTWKAVATAPPGFCHVRSTMIGTLLEDIIAGWPFETVSRKFAEKMHPLQYQRPQAPPSQGNIAQAEKIIQKLEAEGSLARRFARLEEIQTIWKPVEKEEEFPTKKSSIFGHLKTKEDQDRPGSQMNVPVITMTWVKFLETVLPKAEQIEYLVPAYRNNYSALLTAVNPDAPPILQWDSQEKRNPVSHYLYVKGSDPTQWGLKPREMVKVTGIAYQPSMWNDNHKHQGQSVFFILEGCKDNNNSSLCIFPETLKTEFHSIRATIEAYSHSRQLEGQEEASACGLRLQKDAAWNETIWVTTQGQKLRYKLDRWD